MSIVVNILGGLALFLYGMNVLAAGLEKTAGDYMENIIKNFTSNRITGVIVGAFVTMIVQSSSSITVMIVGLVNSGAISIINAVSIIMGANIGTTLTTQLISLNIIGVVPIFIIIGIWIWLFSADRKMKSIGEILIGFGILFIGMEYMGKGVYVLKESDSFYNLITSFGINNLTDNILAILMGFSITAIIQSSSATIALLIVFAMQGLMPLSVAFPIILGANIGTCVTAVISSVGTSNTARRAALIHFLFNIIGSIIFIVFLMKPTLGLIVNLSSNTPRQIANIHSLFNLLNTMILLPFAPILLYIVNKLIPYNPIEEKRLQGIKYLDDRILETPSIAIIQVTKEVLHMGNVALESYKRAMDAFFNLEEYKAKETFLLENLVNEIEGKIADYLLKISNEEISMKQREIVEGLFNTIIDIERVGDHADNLAEQAMYRLDNKLRFSPQALDDLKKMNNWVLKSYREALTALKTGDINIAKRVIERENEIDIMEKTLRANHIDRLNAQHCIPTSGIVFLDMISNLERIADHSSNIAFVVLDIKRAN